MLLYHHHFRCFKASMKSALTMLTNKMDAIPVAHLLTSYLGESQLFSCRNKFEAELQGNLDCGADDRLQFARSAA